MSTEPHFIIANPEDVQAQGDPAYVNIAWVQQARGPDVHKVIMAPVDDNGRTGWCWVRFADGTLILGMFPTGDTYMDVSDSGVCDWGT